MDSLSLKAVKEARFATSDDVISRRMYNASIGIIILLGIISNIIACIFFADRIARFNPLLVFIGALLGGVVSGLLIYRVDSIIVNLLGFFILSTFFGMLVALIVPYYPLPMILKALVITAVIVGTMLIISTIFPTLFAGLGKVLFTSLLIFIIVEVVATFFLGFTATIFDVIAVLIFSLYVGYDWYKSQEYTPTFRNAIGSAADIYMDIVNIFVNVLDIIAKKK